jgi:hypothetical protein
MFTALPYTFIYGIINHTTNQTNFNSKPVKKIGFIMFYDGNVAGLDNNCIISNTSEYGL